MIRRKCAEEILHIFCICKTGYEKGCLLTILKLWLVRWKNRVKQRAVFNGEAFQCRKQLHELEAEYFTILWIQQNIQQINEKKSKWEKGL